MLKKRFFKTKDEVEVTFSIPADGHSEAALLCDMHDWTAIPMKRSDRGKGPFRTRIRIPKDTEVQFRYLLDGCVWKNDDAADAYAGNEFGTNNSVVLTS